MSMSEMFYGPSALTVANSNASLLSNTGTINIDIAASGISMINMSSSTSSSSSLSNEAAFAGMNLIDSDFDGIKKCWNNRYRWRL